MHVSSGPTIKYGILKVISYLLVLLFVYAAASKLLDFNTFQNQLGQSPLLSAYAHWVVWAVPTIEILIAIGLSIPRYKKWGLYGFYGMMIMFTTYIFIILNFADFVPCSCGGILEEMGWTEHLLFNAGFIVLSLVAILLLPDAKNSKPKKNVAQLFGLTIAGMVVVSLLYLGSEKQMKRNNAFVRSYMPHPIEKIGGYNLEYNSYYIAGIGEETVFLGNYSAPLSVTALNISSEQFTNHHIEIDSMHLPYRRVRISVDPPYFYVGDGTIPVLFKGKLNNWEATVYSYRDAYFTQFVMRDPMHIGIATMSSSTGDRAMGMLKKTKEGMAFTLNTEIITTQMDNKFSTDGMLIWNGAHQYFIYLYFYRNQYEVADKLFSHRFTGKTIDTISKAVLDIAYYANKNQYKLGGNSVIVNRRSATYGDFLYVQSDRLGKYEDEDVLRSASIIDVYDITNNTYAFSFYLYHQPDKKLSEFRIHKDLLVALVGNKLWLYRLRPQYFHRDPNSKYTAQYQEEGRTPVEKSRPLIKIYSYENQNF